eukprot:2471173-Pleurochrysis_carterae.AAC.1
MTRLPSACAACRTARSSKDLRAKQEQQGGSRKKMNAGKLRVFCASLFAPPPEKGPGAAQRRAQSLRRQQAPPRLFSVHEEGAACAMRASHDRRATATPRASLRDCDTTTCF